MFLFKDNIAVVILLVHAHRIDLWAVLGRYVSQGLARKPVKRHFFEILRDHRFQ